MHAGQLANGAPVRIPWQLVFKDTHMLRSNNDADNAGKQNWFSIKWRIAERQQFYCLCQYMCWCTWSVVTTSTGARVADETRM